MRSVLPRLLLAASLIALSACATRPAPGDQAALEEYRENNDPLEPTNRVFYAINNGIDTVLFRPAAQAYRFIVPPMQRRHIHNLLTNMSSPVAFTDDVLSGKPRRAGTTLMRFLINTTAGE